MKKIFILLSFMSLVSFTSLNCEQEKTTPAPSQPTIPKTMTITGQKPVVSPFIQISGTAVKEPRVKNQ